jgi:hypothetical protein
MSASSAVIAAMHGVSCILLFGGCRCVNICQTKSEAEGVQPQAYGKREPPCQTIHRVRLLERRAKTGRPGDRRAAGSSVSPTANLAVEGITDHPNRESQTARKPACTPGFLVKSITCSGQIVAIDQSLPNFSRTTIGKTRQHLPHGYRENGGCRKRNCFGMDDHQLPQDREHCVRRAPSG